MRFLERKVLEVLLAEAAKRDYYPNMIEALGVGEDTRVSQDRMQLRVIIEQADAWDAFSEITFRHAEEVTETFWVQFGWGNGVDVIHDYEAHPDADAIIGATTKEIES